MSNIWEYSTSILENKKNLMRGSENDELAEKVYNAWLTNISLSYHSDAILSVNLINGLHHAPNRAQYEFLLSAIKAGKRPRRKWAKATESDELDSICEYYKCSKKTATEYLKTITKDQLQQIKDSVIKGGK